MEPSPLPGKVSGFPLAPEDVVVMESAGGGGYGGPLERDLDLFAADLGEGRITPGVAKNSYGVVLVGERVDCAATQVRCARRSARRTWVAVISDDTLEESTVRVIAVDTRTAGQLDLSIGDVAEVINPKGGPVRVWVSVGEGREPSVRVCHPKCFAMLALSAAARAKIRPVYSEPKAMPSPHERTPH